MNVLLVYHSDYGSTEGLAKAIAAGYLSECPDADLRLQLAAETSLDDLSSADVLLFGSPVHMGGMAWQMKKLIDEASSLWTTQALAGRLAGVFVTSGGLGQAGGGAELTMMQLHAHFLEQGMLVLGFPKQSSGYANGGLHWGVYARTANLEGMPTGIDDAALLAGRSYGAHVAEWAQRLY